MADINGITNLPSQAPTGSSLLAIENTTATGRATVDDVVAASTPVSNLVSNLGNRVIRYGYTNESSVTFSTAFSNTPRVVVTPHNSTSGVWSVTVATVSSSGFTVNRKVWSASSSAWTDSQTYYDWIAIGTP